MEEWREYRVCTCVCEYSTWKGILVHMPPQASPVELFRPLLRSHLSSPTHLQKDRVGLIEVVQSVSRELFWALFRVSLKNNCS